MTPPDNNRYSSQLSDIEQSRNELTREDRLEDYASDIVKFYQQSSLNTEDNVFDLTVFNPKALTQLSSIYACCYKQKEVSVRSTDDGIEQTVTSARIASDAVADFFINIVNENYEENRDAYGNMKLSDGVQKLMFIRACQLIANEENVGVVVKTYNDALTYYKSSKHDIRSSLANISFSSSSDEVGVTRLPRNSYRVSVETKKGQEIVRRVQFDRQASFVSPKGDMATAQSNIISKLRDMISADDFNKEAPIYLQTLLHSGAFAGPVQDEHGYFTGIVNNNNLAIKAIRQDLATISVLKDLDVKSSSEEEVLHNLKRKYAGVWDKIGTGSTIVYENIAQMKKFSGIDVGAGVTSNLTEEMETVFSIYEKMHDKPQKEEVLRIKSILQFDSLEPSRRASLMLEVVSLMGGKAVVTCKSGKDRTGVVSECVANNEQVFMNTPVDKEFLLGLIKAEVLRDAEDEVKLQEVANVGLAVNAFYKLALDDQRAILESFSRVTKSFASDSGGVFTKKGIEYQALLAGHNMPAAAGVKTGDEFVSDGIDDACVEEFKASDAAAKYNRFSVSDYKNLQSLITKILRGENYIKHKDAGATVFTSFDTSLEVNVEGGTNTKLPEAETFQMLVALNKDSVQACEKRDYARVSSYLRGEGCELSPLDRDLANNIKDNLGSADPRAKAFAEHFKDDNINVKVPIRHLNIKTGGEKTVGSFNRQEGSFEVDASVRLSSVGKTIVDAMMLTGLPAEVVLCGDLKLQRKKLEDIIAEAGKKGVSFDQVYVNSSLSECVEPLSSFALHSSTSTKLGSVREDMQSKVQKLEKHQTNDGEAGPTETSRLSKKGPTQ